ncbi:MAG: SDR family NAD(P)-dependent oxidoreductase [Bacillota bacterium]
MNIKDRIAIVTGGASGIGKSIVEKLAKDNAKVIIFDIDKEVSESLARELQQQGHEVFAIQGDVTKWEDVKNVADITMERFGGIDILVNNAGIVRDNLILNMPEEDFDMVININLKGYWLMSKAVLKQMKDKEYGRIINISSRAWLGNPGQSNYSSSKGGVVSLTRSLALEFAKFYVTVNCIAPGLIDTPLIRKLRKEVQESLVKAQPTPMIGQPYDIAYTTLFLASDEARYITGQVIHVDGGKSLATRNI